MHDWYLLIFVILGLVSLALLKKATCVQISPFCIGGLPGPARDCSLLIPGFCESAGKTLLPHGKRIESCSQETSAGGGTGDFGFSCHIFVENTVATAHIPSVQLCEEVLLTINNTCQRANGVH
ncbi:hypothetical protein FB451DRAFT_1170333 [Mycena latifolia]|nr:hypothetical protein FB451DRAFT_1170333 [Mycena latifolia]